MMGQTQQRIFEACRLSVITPTTPNHSLRLDEEQRPIPSGPVPSRKISQIERAIYRFDFATDQYFGEAQDSLAHLRGIEGL
jgi:hypothetical protein